MKEQKKHFGYADIIVISIVSTLMTSLIDYRAGLKQKPEPVSHLTEWYSGGQDVEYYGGVDFSDFDKHPLPRLFFNKVVSCKNCNNIRKIYNLERGWGCDDKWNWMVSYSRNDSAATMYFNADSVGSYDLRGNNLRTGCVHQGKLTAVIMEALIHMRKCINERPENNIALELKAIHAEIKSLKQFELTPLPTTPSERQWIIPNAPFWQLPASPQPHLPVDTMFILGGDTINSLKINTDSCFWMKNRFFRMPCKGALDWGPRSLNLRTTTR